VAPRPARGHTAHAQGAACNRLAATTSTAGRRAGRPCSGAGARAGRRAVPGRAPGRGGGMQRCRGARRSPRCSWTRTWARGRTRQRRRPRRSACWRTRARPRAGSRPSAPRWVRRGPDAAACRRAPHETPVRTAGAVVRCSEGLGVCCQPVPRSIARMLLLAHRVSASLTIRAGRSPAAPAATHMHASPVQGNQEHAQSGWASAHDLPADLGHAVVRSTAPLRLRRARAGRARRQSFSLAGRSCRARARPTHAALQAALGRGACALARTSS